MNNQKNKDPLAITLEEYSEIIDEIEEQPYWRSIADSEMDYADGNQLDGALLKKQREIGLPPAVEDLIGPALLSIQGYETNSRTDWRVTPNGDAGGQDVADALNYKLNQAERESKADRACSDAFRPQIGCGIGWVEVARESDDYTYPYRCRSIHRNEIHWDMKSTCPQLSDARYLRRQRWLAADRIALVFEEHKELINACKNSGPSWYDHLDSSSLDGGMSTGLENAWANGRARTISEDRWYNVTNKEMCIAELWYRRWVKVATIKAPDGRVVEFDEDNVSHVAAVASGKVKVVKSVIPRVRRSYWLGPYLLHDGPTPYQHRFFPYVKFTGFEEDSTRVPYGYVRGMKYSQDALNSGLSKLRWGLTAMRSERTKGAVAMTDAQFRAQIARPDADIILDPSVMAQPGARFEVRRDYQLTDQHYQQLNDNRQTIMRVSAVTAGFMGKAGTATSGLQEQTQVEQSNQSLGRIMDNFRTSRAMVGELLLSMIVEDMGKEPQTVIIEGDAVTEDRAIKINSPEVDEFGNAYLSNDIIRTRLKVSLEDVPSSPSYRGQQLNAMSEAVKSLPAQYQAAMLPFLVSLMDVPFKRDVVKAVREAADQQSPEEIQKQLDQAVQDALAKAGNDIKLRELEIKERKADSEVKNLDAKAVQIGVQAAYAAMQSGAQIAQMPMIAPIADAVMQGAGYQRPNPIGDDPNFPVAGQTAAMNIKSPYIQGQDQLFGVDENTSPQYPPVPSDGESPMRGIETARITDNIQP